LCSPTSKLDDKKCWEEENQLNWNDFNGIKPKQTIQGAFTYTSIYYEIVSKNSILINNCMLKNKSWSNAGIRTNDLLKHEQYHFHLSEVMVRNMRQEISAMDELKLSKLKIIFDKWTERNRIEQDSYDLETSHSQDIKAQIRWQEKIDYELDSLKAYKSPIVILNL
jgi:hypothetical protein